MSKFSDETSTPLTPILIVDEADYGATASTASTETPATDQITNVVIDGEEEEEEDHDDDSIHQIIAPLVNIVNQDDDNELNSSVPTYRDWPWAILFLLQILVMVCLGIWVAPLGYATIHVDAHNITETITEMMRKGDDVTDQDIAEFQEFTTFAASYVQVYPTRILLFFCAPMGIVGYVCVMTTTFLIRPFAKHMVYACLIGSFATSAIVMIGGFLIDPSFFGALVLVGVLCAVGYFCRIALPMVPFAAVNLKGALIGMSQNAGVYVVAFFAAELSVLWPICWCYVLFGVFALGHNECVKKHPEADWEIVDDLDDVSDVCNPPGGLVLMFLLSLYWTSTVIMNTVQVSVAGVMATWCFDKQDANKCCSPAVFGSLFRALTYSFGSICLGSLLQALVSVFRFLVEQAKNQRDRNDGQPGCGDLLFCVLECVIKLFEDALDYFNQWAYVFVGIYGFSYIESGRKVIELFRARGWTAIINNHLVSYVLSFNSFVVALAVGLVAVMYEYSLSNSSFNTGDESFIFGPLPGPRWWAFGSGCLLGLWVSCVAMNVVRGAVNTLIVCLCDSPSVFEDNHPRLALQMTEAWKNVLPAAKASNQPAYGAIVV